MADSKAADKKEKLSVLDDDLRNDILSSWKSISVTEDAVDLKLEQIGKSKKKNFSFENLDMDFDLGGDFGKISAFKMDMSDLDFSFSPKLNKKANETSERDSSRVNFQGKEDRFNFTFDFNSVGNFDIDTTLSEADTLSRKQKDSKNLDMDRTDCKVTEIQDNQVTVADTVNKPKSIQASETIDAMKAHILLGNNDILMTDNHPLRSDVSGDKVLQPGAEILSDKAVYDGREDTVDHSYLLVGQPTIQSFDVQTNPMNNLGEDNLMEALKDGCSPDNGENPNIGGEQSICYNELAGQEAVHEKSTESALPPIEEPLEDDSSKSKILSEDNGKEPNTYTEKVVGWGSNLGRTLKIDQSKMSELSTDYNDMNTIQSNIFANVKESSGVSDSHDTSVTRDVKTVHREMKSQLSLLSNRERAVNKSTPINENEKNIARLKLFSRSDETANLNHGSSVFTMPKSVKMHTLHSDSPSEIRKANICEDAGADFLSYKKIAKGEHISLRDQKTLVTAKEIRLQIDSSDLKENLSKKESEKSETPSVTSIKDCTQSIRHILTSKDHSLPLKSVTKTLDLTDLKNSRHVEEKKLQSIAATMKQTKSIKVLKQKVHENVTPKVPVLNLTQKQKLGTPTLKRKQAPTEGIVHESPLKCLSRSPQNSSKNASEMKIQEQVQQKNMVNVNARDHLVEMPKISKIDTPGQMSSRVLDIPSEMENCGNVEKAEAYQKDLDDLCNMLKKKHEEAKELLVRAVVNNNNLLLLNHPIQDEKIRSVQKLANRLMAMEIEPRLVRAVS